MRLIQDLFTRWRGRRLARTALTRQDALRVFPLRNPELEWSLDEEGLVVAVLKRRDDLKTRVVAGVLDIPESRQVRLDEVGSFVWERSDGEHSVSDIADEMMDHYRLGRREVEVSLGEFLRLLARRGMIAVAVPRDLAESLDPETARALGVAQPELKDAAPPPPAEPTEEPPEEG